METSVDIQEIIRRLMAGQAVDNYTLTNEAGPQFGANDDAARAQFLADNATGMTPTAGVNFSSPERDWIKQYDLVGNLTAEGKDHSGMSAAQAAMLFAGLVGGGIGLESLFGGAATGGAGEAAALAGGGGFDAAPLFQSGGFTPGLDPFSVGGGASTGLGSVGGAATGFGLEAGGLGGLAAGGGGGSFMDKVGSFLGEPANLLKTVGTIGGLYEGLKGQDDTTQTTTRKMDPRIESMVFGADGNSGLLGQARDWAAANPTGQNQTMRDAQAGLRGLLTDPAVLTGYRTQGGTGLGLMNRGVATNPWLKGG